MSVIRRIAGDFRELRWGHVFVELAMLILGILIALAVNNWMEDRRDARTKRQYLELLARDLDQDLAVLAEFAAFEEKQTAESVVAYRALTEGVAAPDKEAAASAMAHMMTRRTLRLSRTAYTDLIGTGNIRLLRNAGLRDRIVNLYETNERLVTILDRNNQVYVDQMYSLYLLDTALIAIRSSSNLAPLDGALKDLDARIAMPVGARDDRLWRLASDAPEWDVLRGKVRMRGAMSLLAIRQSQGIVQQVTAVRRAIADELARRWPAGS